MSALPRYIYDKKGVLYFQRRGWPTVRLVAVGDPDEIVREQQEILNKPLERLPPKTMEGRFETPSGDNHFKAIEASAKKRSARRSRPHDLPDGWAQEQFAKQDGKCAITGVPFVKSRSKHAPLAPSIDRLDSRLGYTPDNCRLVTYIANCAKNQFTEAEFYSMCMAAIKHKAGIP